MLLRRYPPMGSRGTTVYVGNLPNDTREREVEELFDKYGRIRDIDLKLPGRPPAFAFVEFDDPRDAADAVKYRDGYDFGGSRLRVRMILKTLSWQDMHAGAHESASRRS